MSFVEIDIPKKHKYMYYISKKENKE